VYARGGYGMVSQLLAVLKESHTFSVHEVVSDALAYSLKGTMMIVKAVCSCFAWYVCCQQEDRLSVIYVQWWHVRCESVVCSRTRNGWTHCYIFTCLNTNSAGLMSDALIFWYPPPPRKMFRVGSQTFKHVTVTFSSLWTSTLFRACGTIFVECLRPATSTFKYPQTNWPKLKSPSCCGWCSEQSNLAETFTNCNVFLDAFLFFLSVYMQHLPQKQNLYQDSIKRV